MAIVHRAELKPSKIELISAWLPTCSWFDGVAPVERVATYRFDDPDGEVGIETFLVSSGDALFHVPLTYRGAPCEGAGLVGTLEHSVLGPRWVYDGPSDPVYTSVVRDVITTGGRDVDMVFADGAPVPRAEWLADVVGSGADAEAAALALTVARRLPADAPSGAPCLSATWAGQGTSTVVAWLA